MWRSSADIFGYTTWWMQRSFGAKIRCLIVEDEETIRDAFESLLEDLDIACTCVATLADGRKLLESNEYDLVLLDKNLPDGNGLEVAKEISERDCATVICSGFANLSSTLEAIKHGVDDYILKPFDISDLSVRIAKVVDALQLRRTNARLLTELQEQNAMLERVVATDSLTGAYSFHYLRESIGRELSGSTRHRRPLSLALIDVEEFRDLNRRHGHEACDQLLVDIAAAMRGETKGVETLRLEDTVARSGPDEFAILLPDTDPAAAITLLSRLCKGMGEHIKIAGTDISIVSGVASFPEDGANAAELIAAAGIALSAAKEPGSPKILRFNEALAKKGELRRSSTRSAAKKAEALDQSMQATGEFFRYVYQPIVDIRENSIMAYEALVRPQHECFAHPGELFEAAEQSGRMRVLNRILRLLCVEPIGDLDSSRRLFINLHPTDLFDPVLLAGEPTLLSQAHRIVFEVTEVAEIKSFDKARESLEVLREKGFGVAVDDFGAGYSGLNNLALLNPDFVKLDMALVREVDKNPRLARLISHIIDYARGEKIRVIAEGVETESEYRAVKELGVDLVQGYYFARPSPPFIELPKPG
jgi:diguanylate cyclase (GGDEF)-like protein